MVKKNASGGQNPFREKGSALPKAFNWTKQDTQSKNTIEIKKQFFYNYLGSGGGKSLPCSPGGGSPSLHTAYTRFTSLLLTGRDCHHIHYRASSSANSISEYGDVPLGVEQSGPKEFTKVTAAASFSFKKLKFPTNILEIPGPGIFALKKSGAGKTRPWPNKTRPWREGGLTP